MQRILLHRRITALAAMVLLSDCSLSYGAAPAPPLGGVATEKAASGTLLYVANGSAAAGVCILTFPQGKLVATITNVGYPHGVCADTSGHVWVTAYLQGNRFALYEFARGATTPLHTVHRRAFFGACTVDPRGNVAVLTSVNAYAGSIDVWPPSLQGKPHITHLAMIGPVSGAYDSLGNLYLKGYTGSDPAFAELPKGSDKTTWLVLKKGDDFEAGCLGWDGTYVTLGAYNSSKPLIYRLTINGHIARVASGVRLRDLALNPLYALAGSEIVATRGGSMPTSIGVYDYPAGGKPTAVFSGFYKPVQIAISNAKN
jgi:hypothetical protein